MRRHGDQLTPAALRLSGRRPGLPMNALGTKVALALPLGLPVALLYGMRMFVGLSGILVGGGSSAVGEDEPFGGVGGSGPSSRRS